MKTLQDQATQKRYQCTGCNAKTAVRTFLTNHYGECYDICRVCDSEGRRGFQTWKCLEAVPSEFTAPDPWTIVEVEQIDVPGETL
jgi:transcription elongation factor Elf1